MTYVIVKMYTLVRDLLSYYGGKITVRS